MAMFAMDEAPNLRTSREVASPAVPWAAGVILAGGRSQRMGGGNKTLMPLAGKPLISHVLARLSSQVDPIAINANGDPARFSEFGRPIIPDTVDGFVGPLAGICSGMRWARSGAPSATHILTVAADTPFFPIDLGVRLATAVTTKTLIAVAASGGRLHFVFGLWPVEQAEALDAWLRKGSDHAVHRWLHANDFRVVEFVASDEEPFFNINTPADLDAARQSLARAAP